MEEDWFYSDTMKTCCLGYRVLLNWSYSDVFEWNNEGGG